MPVWSCFVLKEWNIINKTVNVAARLTLYLEKELDFILLLRTNMEQFNTELVAREYDDFVLFVNTLDRSENAVIYYMSRDKWPLDIYYSLALSVLHLKVTVSKYCLSFQCCQWFLSFINYHVTIH